MPVRVLNRPREERIQTKARRFRGSWPDRRRPPGDVIETAPARPAPIGPRGTSISEPGATDSRPPAPSGRMALVGAGRSHPGRGPFAGSHRGGPSQSDSNPWRERSRADRPRPKMREVDSDHPGDMDGGGVLPSGPRESLEDRTGKAEQRRSPRTRVRVIDSIFGVDEPGIEAIRARVDVHARGMKARASLDRSAHPLHSLRPEAPGVARSAAPDASSRP